MNALIVHSDMVTAYGRGTDATWRGLLSGNSALARSQRVHCPGSSDSGDSGQTTPMRLVNGIQRESSAVWQMLEPMLRAALPNIPSDTRVLLATTTGEIEILEDAVLNASPADPLDKELDKESDPGALLQKICRLCGTTRGGLVISAACASSTIALAQAAALINSGKESSVLVVACDAVSEFVYAGFATMNALDPSGAHPFDADRKGLNLGEAAAFALVMSQERATRENRAALGCVAGWAFNNDAAHVTRPDLSGEPLARTSTLALERAGIASNEIAFICAHGTGTRHNDCMELAAFSRLCAPRPLFCIKGGIGHTLGAAGLLEALLSLRGLAEGVLPPPVGLREPEPQAASWVQAGQTQPLRINGGAALSTNSGFGGINAALVLTLEAPVKASLHTESGQAPHALASQGIGWITKSAYGRVNQGEINFYSERTTERLVGSVDALFRHKVESFGRFDPVSRMTCYAGALALRDAGVEYSKEVKQAIGILGAGARGSLAANRAFFEDYIHSGRTLARGNLFVYTLPSAPLGEAAIHFGFQGPLLFVTAEETPFLTGLEMAREMVRKGDAPAMLVVQAEAECALAALVGAGSSQNLDRLTELARQFPNLSQLISNISSQQKAPSLCA